MRGQGGSERDKINRAWIIALTGLVVLVVGGFGGCMVSGTLELNLYPQHKGYGQVWTGMLAGILVGVVAALVVMFQMASRARDRDDNDEARGEQ